MAAALLAVAPRPCLAGDPATIAWRTHIAPLSGFFGLRVGRAGDINNDGVEDYCSTSPFPFHGFILMYSGATGEVIHELHREGIQLFAMSIAAVGDVDGDNYDDVAIGTPARLIDNEMLGEVIVVSGQTGSILWAVEGSESADLFGWSLAACGDLDGDGITDLIVGAPGTDAHPLPPNVETERNVGAAAVLSGATGAPLLSWTGSQPNGQAGFSVAAPGDLNDDGVPDLAIGADVACKVFLIDGVNGYPVGQLNGQAGSGFGYSMAVAGDVDDDGVDDLIVGAPRFMIGGEPCGRATIYSGRTQQVIRGFTGDDRSELGSSVSALGDVDDDGYDDVIVAARRYPYGLNRSGRVTVYSGATGLRLNVISGPFDSTRFGSAVCGLSDLTGDGIPEYIVGHERYGVGLGAAYIFSGLPNPPGTMQAASQASGWITPGRTVVGDLDDDGAADLLTLGSAFDRVTVRMNRGDGQFWGPANLAVGRGPSDATLVDLDRDGDLDMVVALAGENRIAMYSNTHGILLRSGTIKVGRKPGGVVARDLDGDHTVDLAGINRRDNTLMILRQRRGVNHLLLHERFRPPRTIDLPAEPASLHLAMLNADTRRDLVIVSNAAATAYGIINRGGGQFDAPRSTVLSATPAAVAVGDFNGDELDDLAWCDGTSAAINVQSGSADGAFLNPTIHLLDDVPVNIRAINANSDRAMDLITANGDSANATLLIMPVDPSSGEPLISTHATVATPKWLGSADFDDDHDVDAVFINADGAVTLLFNQIFN